MPAVEVPRLAADCDKCDKDMCKICFMCLIIAFYGPRGCTHTHTSTRTLLPSPHLPVIRCKTNSKLSKCLRNVVEFQVCFKYLRNSKNPENVFNYI